MGYSYGKTASVEDFAAAMRRYVLSAVHWIDSLFQMVSLGELHEKVLCPAFLFNKRFFRSASFAMSMLSSLCSVWPPGLPS